MKAIFFFIHLGLAALVVYLGVMLYHPERFAAEKIPAVARPGSQTKALKKNTGPEKEKPDKDMTDQIIRRNLFNVLTDDKSVADTRGEAARPALEKTTLKLALWGTVAGDTAEDCWAVIEDQAKRSQALYKVGDQIQGGKIKEIARNRVILAVNGKDQVLEARTAPAPGPSLRPPVNAAAPKPVKIPVKGNIKDPGALVRMMKTRPHLKDGAPSGLLVYGIRPGSDVMALGLKNGDIVQAVNGMDIVTPNDLATVAEGLGSDPDIRISLVRRGQAMEVVYNGQTRAFTTRTAKD